MRIVAKKYKKRFLVTRKYKKYRFEMTHSEIFQLKTIFKDVIKSINVPDNPIEECVLIEKCVQYYQFFEKAYKEEEA